MTGSARTALQRIDLCLEQVRHDLEMGDQEQTLSDCAELFELTRRLWCYLADAEGYSCVEAQLKLSGGGEN